MAASQQSRATQAETRDGQASATAGAQAIDPFAALCTNGRKLCEAGRLSAKELFRMLHDVDAAEGSGSILTIDGESRLVSAPLLADDIKLEYYYLDDGYWQEVRHSGRHEAMAVLVELFEYVTIVYYNTMTGENLAGNQYIIHNQCFTAGKLNHLQQAFTMVLQFSDDIEQEGACLRLTVEAIGITIKDEKENMATGLYLLYDRGNSARTTEDAVWEDDDAHSGVWEDEGTPRSSEEGKQLEQTGAEEEVGEDRCFHVNYLKYKESLVKACRLSVGPFLSNVLSSYNTAASCQVLESSEKESWQLGPPGIAATCQLTLAYRRYPWERFRGRTVVTEILQHLLITMETFRHVAMGDRDLLGDLGGYCIVEGQLAVNVLYRLVLNFTEEADEEDGKRHCLTVDSVHLSIEAGKLHVTDGRQGVVTATEDADSLDAAGTHKDPVVSRSNGSTEETMNDSEATSSLGQGVEFREELDAACRQFTKIFYHMLFERDRASDEYYKLLENEEGHLWVAGPPVMSDNVTLHHGCCLQDPMMSHELCGKQDVMTYLESLLVAVRRVHVVPDILASEILHASCTTEGGLERNVNFQLQLIFRETVDAETPQHHRLTLEKLRLTTGFGVLGFSLYDVFYSRRCNAVLLPIGEQGTSGESEVNYKPDTAADSGGGGNTVENALYDIAVCEQSPPRGAKPSSRLPSSMEVGGRDAAAEKESSRQAAELSQYTASQHEACRRSAHAVFSMLYDLENAEESYPLTPHSARATDDHGHRAHHGDGRHDYHGDQWQLGPPIMADDVHLSVECSSYSGKQQYRGRDAVMSALEEFFAEVDTILYVNIRDQQLAGDEILRGYCIAEGPLGADEARLFRLVLNFRETIEESDSRKRYLSIDSIMILDRLLVFGHRAECEPAPRHLLAKLSYPVNVHLNIPAKYPSPNVVDAAVMSAPPTQSQRNSPARRSKTASSVKSARRSRRPFCKRPQQEVAAVAETDDDSESCCPACSKCIIL
eukprot:scpid28536/ scgid29793/ 